MSGNELDSWLDNSDINTDSDFSLHNSPIHSPTFNTIIPSSNSFFINQPKSKILPLKKNNLLESIDESSTDSEDLYYDSSAMNNKNYFALETQSIQYITNSLRSEIANLINEKEKDKQPKNNLEDNYFFECKPPGSKIIIFHCDEEDFKLHEPYIFKPGVPFIHIFHLLPEKYSNHYIELDGLKMLPSEVPIEMIEDNTQFILKSQNNH